MNKVKLLAVENRILPTLFIFCQLHRLLSFLLSVKMRLAGEKLCRESTSSNASRLTALWKMFSIPRNAKGNYDWNAIADGRYYVEWYVGGTRRREGAGVTAAQALEAQRRKRHELEGPQTRCPRV